MTEQSQPTPTPDEPRYFNRDISWLEFNRRVLAQAADDSFPLLERVKFLAIFANNLDEFFMKRVGLLKRYIASGVETPSPDGRRPTQTLAELRAMTKELQAEQARIWLEIAQPQLTDAGIQILRYDELTDDDRRGVDQWYRDNVFPILTPLAVDPGHKFPFISNLSENLGVLVGPPGGTEQLFARIKVPDVLPRFVDIERTDRLIRLLPLDELIKNNLDDGSYYNGMRIEGRFYHSFELARFPLDAHQLEIRIENVDFTADSLVYVPDTMTHLVRPDFMIPGWAITDARMEANTNFYATSFGDPQDRGSSYSNFTFSLTITRPASYFLLKLMLPLLVVIMASLGALFIAPTYVDARFSLPIGGLLSCVFLQQSYSSALPDVGYMVLMDKIYLLSYLLIGLIMLRVLLASNALAHDTSADHRAVRRQDRRLWWSLTALYLLGIGILLIVS